MNIKVLFNSKTSNNNLSTGWGLAFLIDDNVLFDTGENGELLINNINSLHIDINQIKSIVISHDHWDHTGGLWDLLTLKPDIKVYGCPGFTDEFKNKVRKLASEFIELSDFTRITTKIYSTGEIICKYKGKDISEQSLIVNTNKGLSIITGCAHTGIINIIKKVKSQLSVDSFYSVFGGFHLKNTSQEDIQKIADEFLQLKVKQVGATHCSGEDAEKIFKEIYGNRFLSMDVGQDVVI